MLDLTNLFSQPVFIIKSIYNFLINDLNFDNNEHFAAFIKYSVMSYNLCLVLTLFSLIMNTLTNFFPNAGDYTMKVIRYINILVLIMLLSLLLVKFYITLKIENLVGVYIYDIKLNFYSDNKNLGHLEHFAVISSSFGDAVLVLSIMVGLVCVELLGSKNLFKSINNISIFYLFTFFVIIMVSTNNLLIMFISFEFIFLPTIYFAYSLGYSKKVDVAGETLIYWTLFGSFLVLCNLAYLFYQYNTLNYLYLSSKDFSVLETRFLFFNFLLGFGIKIPIAPLHYWLLKVHVESPTAFSIYLSGFLVKSALYCLYMFVSIFNNNDLYISLILWILYSLVISTLGLARQVDIKKIIAWATIQEMSFMLIFLVFKQTLLMHTCVIFILLHGLMSAYMFYLVDILQRRFKTRSLQHIRGLNLLFPELTKYIWFLILMFSGFPLTIKFYVEWSLISLLIETNRFLLILVLFFVNFLGVIFFCKVMLTILYGSPSVNKEDIGLYEIQKKEKIILKTLIYAIMLLIPIMYFI